MMDELHQRLGPLIRAVQGGDQKAFSQIIELTQDRLFRYCVLFCKRREVAEDLCQETFMRAFAKLHQVAEGQAFLGWLFQLAKNIYIDQMRLKSSQEIPSEVIRDQSAVNHPVDRLMMVQQALSHFDPEDRHLLLMVDLEGFSYLEASKIIGISEDAVRSRLHRLRQALKEKLTA